MKARDLIAETASAISANRARSLLTILGIVIGIAAVISMTAFIDGIKQSLVSQLGLQQARGVYISFYLGRDFTQDDLKLLNDNLSDTYEFITGGQSDTLVASTDTAETTVFTTGVDANYIIANGSKLMAGRFPTQSEFKLGSQVIVLEPQAARELFTNPEDAIGQNIQLGSDTFSVVGVLESQGFTGGESLIPYKTFQARVTNRENIDRIIGYVKEDVDMGSVEPITVAAIYRLFNVYEGESGETYVGVRTMASLIDDLQSTMGAFQMLMVAVSSISLLVGGIGIMNMMLTNVTERIREIGLRKALGARRSVITIQFLLESITLCLVGGIIGILFGYLGATAVAFFASQSEMAGTMQIVPYVSPQAIIMTTSICTGIGIIFGFYPAWRAARLDPVESLHYQ
ncbi:MAG: ABC transporter permease [Atopobiaceae bacterium]|jgi:ABC-type antimicrobial peptide transport system permease subunit